MTAQSLPLPLRDIHLPDSILWWPLAIGWWVLMALLFIFMVGLGYFYYQKKQRDTANSSLIDALRILKKLTKETNKVILITHISRLLRRVCISLYGRKQVAGLTGERWLRFLDRKGKTTEFSQGIGRILIDSPYQKTVDYPRQELLNLIQYWLESQKKHYV